MKNFKNKKYTKNKSSIQSTLINKQIQNKNVFNIFKHIYI